MKSVKITAITIRPDTKPAKGRDMRGPCFFVPCTYTLEDGTEKKNWISAPRKKDLPRYIERQEKAIAAGAMKVETFTCGDGTESTMFVTSGLY